MNYINHRLTAEIPFFDCNLIIPTPVFGRNWLVWQVHYSLLEKQGTREVPGYKKICAQQDSSLTIYGGVLDLSTTHGFRENSLCQCSFCKK